MSEQKKRILTGITTTGIPHLGNYVGSIRPAIASANAAVDAGDGDAFFFWQIITASSNALILKRFTDQPKPLQQLGLLVVLILKKSPFIVSQIFLRFLSLPGCSTAHAPKD